MRASLLGIRRQPLIRCIVFACISIGLSSCGTRAAPVASSGQGSGGAVGAGGAFGSGGAAGGGGAFGSGGAPGGVPDGGANRVGGDGATGGDGPVDATDVCQPILNQAGLDTGFESCVDGSKRRRAAIVCPTEKTSASSPCQSTFGLPSCRSDSDCVAQPGGYCADAHKLSGYCGCYYGCRQDSDCGAGSICECGVVLGRCVPATCTTNADCGAGLACAHAAAVPGPVAVCIGFGTAVSSYTCQTTSDQCQSDSTCPSNGRDRGVCVFDGGHRICGTMCFMPV